MRPHRLAAPRRVSSCSALSLPAILFAIPLVVAAVAPGTAKEIKVPKDKPKVVLDIPDDWTVLTTKTGYELESPDKTAIVVAGIVKLSRAELAGWQKQATQKMTDFGIKFDPNAKAPPRVAKPADPTSPGASAAKPATADVPPVSVFSGAPTLATPEQASKVETATEDKKLEGLSLEQLTGKTSMGGGPQLRFKSVVLYGATLQGKPVDVQFLNFAVAKDTAFLMQQESSPTDNRVGDIVNSVRPAP